MLDIIINYLQNSSLVTIFVL